VYWVGRKLKRFFRERDLPLVLGYFLRTGNELPQTGHTSSFILWLDHYDELALGAFNRLEFDSFYLSFGSKDVAISIFGLGF
jgi:hypothetical protein